MMVHPPRSAGLVLPWIVLGCGAGSREPPRLSAPHATVAPALPRDATPRPASTQATELALAKLAAADQEVIRAALRRGFGKSEKERWGYSCDDAHRQVALAPGGTIVPGCRAVLWLDEGGAVRGCREAFEVVEVSGGIAALRMSGDRPLDVSFTASADGPATLVPLRAGERFSVSSTQGASFIAELTSESPEHIRWVSGMLPRAGRIPAKGLLQVDGARDDGDSPFLLSDDGEWLLERRGDRTIAHRLETGDHFDLPARCSGVHRFFGVEPTARHLYLAISTDQRRWVGTVRTCVLDFSGHLVRVEALKPPSDSSCVRLDRDCAPMLDHVLLGGLVRSLHEETGYGALPSVLRDARSGRDIAMPNFLVFADRIEGLDQRDERWVLTTLRGVSGKLVRVEKVVDEAFAEGWLRGPPPPRTFDYCIVSGVPIPIALCPPEELASSPVPGAK